MAATPKQRHVVLLDDLPPELLRQVVDLCADDISAGRATLLSLSVMNKYLRSVTASRLFERVRFRDSPESPGDEILHSIRRFKAAPELSCHTRTVSLYLNRLKFVGPQPFTLTRPYHYLVFPELVDTLVKLPATTELYISLGGEQGVRCLDGLEAAVCWCLAGRKLNIRSLTVSLTSLESNWFDERLVFENAFLRALPQLETFCYQGAHLRPTQMILSPQCCSGPTTAPNLAQVRVYKTCSDPRSRFWSFVWTKDDFEQLSLVQITPNLEYLSILGELGGFLVSHILIVLEVLPKLKYLDITDEQAMDGYYEGREFMKSTLPRQYSSRLNYIKDLARNHPLNEDRSALARRTFDRCAQLQRICFVRSSVGEVYLRGYPGAVADSTGYISHEIHDADMDDIPKAWRHGVPQTGLLPFPGFTPWEGIDEA